MMVNAALATAAVHLINGFLNRNQAKMGQEKSQLFQLDLHTKALQFNADAAKIQIKQQEKIHRERMEAREKRQKDSEERIAWPLTLPCESYSKLLSNLEEKTQSQVIQIILVDNQDKWNICDAIAPFIIDNFSINNRTYPVHCAQCWKDNVRVEMSRVSFFHNLFSDIPTLVVAPVVSSGVITIETYKWLPGDKAPFHHTVLEVNYGDLQRELYEKLVREEADANISAFSHINGGELLTENDRIRLEEKKFLEHCNQELPIEKRMVAFKNYLKKQNCSYYKKTKLIKKKALSVVKQLVVANISCLSAMFVDLYLLDSFCVKPIFPKLWSQSKITRDKFVQKQLGNVLGLFQKQAQEMLQSHNQQKPLICARLAEAFKDANEDVIVAEYVEKTNVLLKELSGATPKELAPLEHIEALELINSLQIKKDLFCFPVMTAEQIEQFKLKKSASRIWNQLMDSEVGDTVHFGLYQQNDDVATPLEWIVLSNDNNFLLLLSKKRY